MVLEFGNGETLELETFNFKLHSPISLTSVNTRLMNDDVLVNCGFVVVCTNDKDDAVEKVSNKVFKLMERKRKRQELDRIDSEDREVISKLKDIVLESKIHKLFSDIRELKLEFESLQERLQQLERSSVKQALKNCL